MRPTGELLESVCVTGVPRQQDSVPMQPISCIPQPRVTTFAKIFTNCGDITVRFNVQAAPRSAAKFIDLASSGFFTGKTFYNIIPGRVAYAGLCNTFSKQHSSVQDDSSNQLKHVRGAIGITSSKELAKYGAGFYICLARCKEFDGNRNLFGQVVGSDDLLNHFDKVDVESRDLKTTHGIVQMAVPVNPVVIKRIEIKSQLSEQTQIYNSQNKLTKTTPKQLLSTTMSTITSTNMDTISPASGLNASSGSMPASKVPKCAELKQFGSAFRKAVLTLKAWWIDNRHKMSPEFIYNTDDAEQPLLTAWVSLQSAIDECLAEWITNIGLNITNKAFYPSNIHSASKRLQVGLKHLIHTLGTFSCNLVPILQNMSQNMSSDNSSLGRTPRSSNRTHIPKVGLERNALLQRSRSYILLSACKNRNNILQKDTNGSNVRLISDQKPNANQISSTKSRSNADHSSEHGKISAATIATTMTTGTTTEKLCEGWWERDRATPCPAINKNQEILSCSPSPRKLQSSSQVFLSSQEYSVLKEQEQLLKAKVVLSFDQLTFPRS